jgi:hypothetical protein
MATAIPTVQPAPTHHIFGKVTVTVWRIPISQTYWACSPWRFSLTVNGKTTEYTGVPNYCDTHHSALMRGWHRAKWLNNKTYHQHYKPL